MEMLLQHFELPAGQKPSAAVWFAGSSHAEALHVELEKCYLALERLQLGRKYYQELL